jgi:hypothetical protein
LDTEAAPGGVSASAASSGMGTNVRVLQCLHRTVRPTNASGTAAAIRHFGQTIGIVTIDLLLRPVPFGSVHVNIERMRRSRAG